LLYFPAHTPLLPSICHFCLQKSNQQFHNYKLNDIISHSLGYLFDLTVSNFSNWRCYEVLAGQSMPIYLLCSTYPIPLPHNYGQWSKWKGLDLLCQRPWSSPHNLKMVYITTPQRKRRPLWKLNQKNYSVLVYYVCDLPILCNMLTHCLLCTILNLYVSIYLDTAFIWSLDNEPNIIWTQKTVMLWCAYCISWFSKPGLSLYTWRPKKTCAAKLLPNTV
jgi:hypothetical protein